MTPKAKLAIMLPTTGADSEVWAYRQAVGLSDRFDVAIVVWDRLGTELDRAYDRFPVLEIGVPWNSNRSVFERITRRMGVDGIIASGRARRERGEILRVIGDLGPDIVLCHFAWTGMRLLSAMHPEFPTVWHVHGRDVGPELENSSSYARSFRRLGRRASALVAVGTQQAGRVERALGSGEPSVHVIPCGVPTRTFARVDRPVDSEHGLVFLQVGRLSPEKGTVETVEAFAAIADRYPDATLEFIGHGPSESELRQRIDALGLGDRVILRGSLDTEEVAACMRRADVLVQNSIPTRNSVEGFGVTVAEGGCTGLPTIATAVGGLLDQIEDGVNGITVPPKDIDALSRSMDRLAGDSELRMRLGAQASVMAARFDADLMVEKLASVLTSLSPRADSI